jgi:membrane protease YdiL (CAAX protease family)
MALTNLKSLLSRAPAEVRFALVLTLLMSLGALLFLASIPASRFDKAVTVVSFALLLLPYLLFTSPHFLQWLRQRTAQNRFAFPAMLLAVYTLYALGPGRLRMPESLEIPVYLGLPILFASLAARRSERPNRYDLLAVLFLYLPVELSALAGAWRPADLAIRSPSHPFNQLLAMNLALFCFLVIRPVEGMGFTFRLQRRDVVQALIGFAWFFPLALVFGTTTGFVPFEPHLPDPRFIVPVVLGLSLMVALPEEVLFRGLAQNLLQRAASTSRGRVAVLIAVSVFFGLSHLNNNPIFDWRYVTAASVAGLAYGTVYNRTGKVTAAAITHALVDIVWRLCF